MQFAVDETNAAGGLLGKQIKLITEDSQMKPDVAARKAIRAIMEDKAQFIFQSYLHGCGPGVDGCGGEEQGDLYNAWSRVGFPHR